MDPLSTLDVIVIIVGIIGVYLFDDHLRRRNFRGEVEVRSKTTRTRRKRSK